VWKQKQKEEDPVEGMFYADINVHIMDIEEDVFDIIKDVLDIGNVLDMEYVLIGGSKLLNKDVLEEIEL